MEIPEIAVGPEEFPFKNPRTSYDEWTESQGIAIYRCQYVRNLLTLPLTPWSRKGANGAFIHHSATIESNDAYVCEIPPGSRLVPQRHLYEEMVYILSGRGATAVWLEQNRKVTFEWKAGSLFAIPLNAWHQHFNGQGSEPARYVAVTNSPLVFNTFKSATFVMENDHRFIERFDAKEDYFNGSGQMHGKVWESNFVPDARSIGLVDHSERGAGGVSLKFALAGNAMGAHTSEFAVGTYKKAHWHGPGAHVIILSGEGYSLMWPEGEEPRRFDWQPGSLLIPPGGWYHQHFNIGSSPARYLALRFHGALARMQGLDRPGSVDRKRGGNQIGYDEEAPMVREMYLTALRERGVGHKMAEYWR